MEAILFQLEQSDRLCADNLEYNSVLENCYISI